MASVYTIHIKIQIESVYMAKYALGNNIIALLFMTAIPIVAVIYVVLFNGGKARDTIALVMTGVSILVRLLQKPLGRSAKYLYVSILPVISITTFVKIVKYLLDNRTKVVQFCVFFIIMTN